MRFELTSALETALNNAQAWARAFGASQVEPHHVLLALLQEEEGRPALLMAEAGVSAAAVSALLAEGLIPQGGEKVPLGSLSKQALSLAADYTPTMSAEGTVSTEQMLLALLEQAAELRGRLQALGYNHARVQSTLITGQGPPLAMEHPLDFSDTGSFDVARILDAAANRAREALRVLEDYARFVLNDRFLTSELKNLRHAMTQAMVQLPDLLPLRDTEGDVGTDVDTRQEFERDSSLEVAQANCKRLQEALRSLEEYGKVQSGDFGRAIETIRYKSYSLEKAFLTVIRARDRLADAKLYVLVTEAQCKASLYGTVAEALAGGAQLIQLREKSMPDRVLLEHAREIRKITRAHSAILIINDRPDLARLAEADGVHLGQDDLPVREARRIVGGDALIGVSTHNIDQLRQAVIDGADYVGLGPTFPSATKNFSEFAGLDFVRQAVAETSLPAFVLGGVTLENVKDVTATGGRRVAVSNAICQADDPRSVAAKMRRLLV